MQSFKENLKELFNVVKEWYQALPQPAKSITLFVAGVLVGGIIF